ncbi:TPA: toprim domain-containing protein [Streptococcus pyogenes]|nr:toprim domain-containing protein [Streptococcus pyogenes]
MVFTKAQAKSLSILEVARSLGMEMKRNSHKEYYWVEHDSFKIDTHKNTWHWYSHADKYGDTINLVQEIKGVSYREAMYYLETGTFPEAKPMEEIRQPFRYTLAPYEQPFREARNYLKEVRGLSDETIDFFIEKGVVAQARRRDRDGFTEDVLVFKYLDKSQNIVGASLQGLSSYPDRYEGKGYLKQIMYQSEGIAGLNVDIGSPKRLVVAEAPIDLMSYYELHKEQLEDVRLVAMEGLKEGIVSRYAMEALQEQGVLVENDHRDYTKASDLTKTSQFLAIAAQTSTLFHDHKQDNLITLAVDDDKAGSDFIETLREKKIPIIDARPPKGEGDRKMDWNQYLQENKTEGKAMTQDAKKAPEPILEQEKKEGTNFSSGSLQPKAEGSPAPVAETSATFEQTVTSRPTLSPRLLHFNITEEFKSSDGGSYQYIDKGDLGKLNRRAEIIQEAAQYYLKELADSKISYVTSQGSIIQVNFQEQNFMHLTGIKPLGPGQTPEKTLHDLASGNGEFENIMLANADGAFSKINVLPDLPVVLSLDAFYFDDLQDLRRYNGRFDSLLKTDDKDIMLLFRVTEQDGRIPVSLWEARSSHLRELKQTTKNEIVAIYREREGKVEQIAINESVIKDGGKEIEAIVEAGDFTPIQGVTFKEETALIHPKIDSDGDGISDEEELKQGSNPYDFRSTPSSKAAEEASPDVTESIGTSSSLAVADFIKNKDIAGLNRHLKAGIKEYLNSDKYKDYLTKMSQLNNYSSRNLRLILAQNPEATQVASFKQWKEIFERHVKKGEKSIRIFAPMTKLKKDENNQPILDKNGKPETVTFFGLVPVFDVSQTDGKEMPKAISEVNEQLTDLDYANLYRALMIIAKDNNVSVRFEEMQGEAKGYYNPAEHQIVLRSNDMNKSQLIKTFLHETAHSELHHANNPQEKQLTRSTAELQAESVAYVVSAYYGLDTSDYSFGYLASWSDDKETLADLEAQLDIVQQEAKSLLVRMDQQLEQLRLAQEKQTKYQFEQKLQKFKDQSKQAVEEHKQELKQEAQSKKEKGLSK